MRLTPRVPRGALTLMFFFSSFFFFTNRGTDFARKEVLRLVHLERKSVISCQSFLFGTRTFVFSFSSLEILGSVLEHFHHDFLEGGRVDQCNFS